VGDTWGILGQYRLSEKLKYKESARYLGEVFDASRLMSQSERGKQMESSECIQKVSKTRWAWSWRHGSMLLNGIHSMK
jgi:hypothetical protein